MMKIYILSLALLLPIFNGHTRPLNINNRGYSMGQLHKVNLKGRMNQVVEGELLLGRDSHSNFKSKDRLNKNYRMEIDNPWLFCADRNKLYDLETLVGEYVIVEYKTPRGSTLLKCKAENQLIRIYPIIRDNTHLGTYASSPKSLNTQSSGVNTGRLVNVFKTGKHTSNFRIILQEGNSGSHFTKMTIPDEDLYQFAVDSLLRANKVNVYYIERFFSGGRWRDAEIYVWKIKTLNDI